MEREVALGERHRQMGARMVPFAGYQMPLQYTSIREEHTAVRQRAGLFDVTHMGEVSVRGRRAEEYLQHLVTNDIAKLAPGQALYTVMCRPDGGIVDDLLVYRDADDFMCVINAARHDADLEWMGAQLPPSEVVLEDVSAGTCLLALQGPAALRILEPLAKDGPVGEIPYYHHRPGNVLGAQVRISRTGYTGEDGFELYCDPADVERLWEGLLEHGRAEGVLPAGLGARDTLRLEAGFRLYGQDIDLDHDPISAGLGWVVKLDKGEFEGSAALRRIKADPQLSFVGVRLGPREIPRPHQSIVVAGEPVGEVTSGSYGFTVAAGIAMGYVRAGAAPRGAEVEVALRAQPAQMGSGTVVPLPFYRRQA